MSPDGNLVAFAWSGNADAGPTDIYVKAVESEAFRQLTATPASETGPAWSPDGHNLAFVRSGQGVFTISQLGGTERQVSASGTHVAWAGDSKSVLIRDRQADTRPFGIYQVFLDTLDRRQLTQAPVGAGDWRFEVSPDGRTLAFIRYEKVGIADVYVVPIGGGEPRRLTNWNAAIEGLSWTPDGREIIYSLDEPPASRLWRIPANSFHTKSRLADCRHPGGGHESVDLETNARPAGAPRVPNDHTRRRPSADRSRPACGRHARVEALFQFHSRRGFLPILARRQPDCVCVVPFRNPGNLARWTRWKRASPAHDTWRYWNLDRWMVPGRSTNRVRSGHRRQYCTCISSEQMEGICAAAYPNPAVDGVPTWSNDGQWIYFASTRGGAVPDVWRVRPNGANRSSDTQRRLRAA